MKVKDLIMELSKLNEDLDVICNDEHGELEEVENVSVCQAWEEESGKESEVVRIN